MVQFENAINVTVIVVTVKSGGLEVSYCECRQSMSVGISRIK